MQQIHEGKPLYVGVDTVAYDFGMWRGRNRKGARHEQDKETAGDLSSCLYV